MTAEKSATKRIGSGHTRLDWREMRQWVEDFKLHLFDISYELQKDDESQPRVDLRKKCYAIMDEFNEKLTATAELMSDKQADNDFWSYAFREIFPYFMRSRFAERAYYKPKGYAGDFLMMEMIYRNREEGDGKLGKLIDGWCLETGAARAVRGRRKYLKEKLSELSIKMPTSGMIRVTNLGCGANRELFDFFEEYPFTERIEALCIDADIDALEYTNRFVNVFPHRASVRLLRGNIIRWALGRIFHQMRLQNIIYSAGLADYLDDEVFTLLVRRAYECLDENGALIIGNFGDSNHNRAFLDNILQWKLIHRTEEDLRKIFSKTAFGGNISVESEENGINLFAIGAKRNS